jgi:hypothetical protein
MKFLAFSDQELKQKYADVENYRSSACTCRANKNGIGSKHLVN